MNFPNLIFHRPEGIEAPMNGAPVSFNHCDKNKNGEGVSKMNKKRAIEELENFVMDMKRTGFLLSQSKVRAILPRIVFEF